MLEPYLNKNLIEAGCDEVGRGCLAGDVVAAAVILPKSYANEKLNDSKKLSSQQREVLANEIKTHALAWAIGVVTPQEIDKINILNASILAMHRALDKLNVVPETIIVDGNRFKEYKKIPYTTIVKGDSKYQSIAAASIIAKVFRDNYMMEQDKLYPEYDWINNKGYPTPKHLKAINTCGITSLHRKSFAPIRQPLLNFDEKP